MNKINIFLVIVSASLTFMLGATMQGKAQDKSFAGVVPFMATSNRLGFFDQKNGRVYMYDDSIRECLFVGQVTDLGKTIQVLAKTSN